MKNIIVGRLDVLATVDREIELPCFLVRAYFLQFPKRERHR